MMRKQELPISVIKFCKKNGITHEFECGTDVEFKSPPGKVFSTEAKHRLLQVYDYYCGSLVRVMKAREIINLLVLFPPISGGDNL